MSAVAAAPALLVEDLRVELAGRPVDIVDEVSLRLARGEVLGLVGESGSGKSTVSLALLGYARPGARIARGTVAVDGVDLLALDPERLRAQRGRLVSYVPQDPATALNPALRIGAQLAEVLETHAPDASAAERAARVAELLRDVRLPTDGAFLRRYPHQLSGGQQQRVCLAIAFACRPRVVVLDEPTTGLDVTTQAHVLRTVRRLCEEHDTAAVYVTHDLAVVRSIAHRIAVMYAGRLVEVGPAAELTDAPAHPYTRRLVEAIPDPRLRRPLEGIPGRVAPLGRRPDGCGFADRCAFAEPACRAQAIELAPIAASHVARCRRVDAVRALPSAWAGQLADAAAGVRRAGGETSLEVRGLTASHGEQAVLHGVDLDVPRGSCLALVGESGSGKTTLARSVAGLHAQWAGVVRVAGAELAPSARARPADVRRRIQYVFQNPYSSLNPRKPVGELLAQPVRFFDRRASRADVRRRVGGLLEQVSLDARFAARYPAQLSGGERQRVAIARALAAGPELLICDEVTSALDVSVQASVLRLLARLQAERELTLLFVTHNFGVVRAIADTVAVLNLGRIVEHGPAARVLDDPRDEYTRRLLADTPTLTGGPAAELIA